MGNLSEPRTRRDRQGFACLLVDVSPRNNSEPLNNIKSHMEELKNELQALFDEHNKWCVRDWFTAQVLFWIGILSAFSATSVLVLFKDVPKEALAIMAAVPGLILIITNTFSFAERSNWHELYRARLRGLLRRLRDQNERIETISSELSALEVAMITTFPQLKAEALTEKIKHGVETQKANGPG